MVNTYNPNTGAAAAVPTHRSIGKSIGKMSSVLGRRSTGKIPAKRVGKTLGSRAAALAASLGKGKGAAESGSGELG